MKSFVLAPFSVFVGNGYVHQASAEYIGHSILRYHVDVITKRITLPDAIEFSYGSGFVVKK